MLPLPPIALAFFAIVILLLLKPCPAALRWRHALRLVVEIMLGAPGGILQARHGFLDRGVAGQELRPGVFGRDGKLGGTQGARLVQRIVGVESGGLTPFGAQRGEQNRVAAVVAVSNEYPCRVGV